MSFRSRPFKTLCVIYAITILAGFCEFLSRPAKPKPEIDIYGRPENGYSSAVSRLYPSTAEAEYALGRHFEAKAGRGFNPIQVQRDPEVRRQFLASLNADLNEAATHYAAAISKGLKSDENLIYNYALTLIRTRQSPEAIDAAIAEWRRNFPFSDRRDLDERRRSIERELRNLANVTGENAATSPALPNQKITIPFPSFDSAKQISALIDGVNGTKPPEWRPNPGFVGSDACRECHPAAFDSYRRTPHSKALSLVNAEDEPRDAMFDHAISSRRFRVEERDGSLRLEESLLLDDDTELPLSSLPLKYRVGSGRFARTYLAEIREGLFFESPATWYESARSWGMTPGFNKSDHKSVTPPVLENCLMCHCGQLQKSNENDMQLRIVEASIGCERCHGPGEKHIAIRRDKLALNDDPIVNPRQLSRHRVESVCRQCHLQSDIQVGGRNRRSMEFQPGADLEEFSTVYRLDHQKDDMTVVGHVEQLNSSACYKQSNSLTCVTCHHPHKTVDPKDRPAFYRQICLSCHKTADCRENPIARAKTVIDDCVQCHMPGSKTEVPHVTFTHHKIGVHQLPNRQSQPPRSSPANDDGIVALSNLSVLSEPDRERSMMLARIQALFLRGPDFSATPLAREWKSQIADWFHHVQDPDPETQVAHIQFLILCGQTDVAVESASHLIDEPRLRSEEVAAIRQQLAEHAVAHHETTIARNQLRRLTEIRMNGHDWFELGKMDVHIGNIDSARQAFEISRRLLPADLQIYESLRLTMQSSHDIELKQIQADITRLKRKRTSRSSVEKQ